MSNFVWGAATSAYQIEGAWQADGKPPSIWDTFTHRRGGRKIKNRENADVACNHYAHWREDIKIMQALNLQAYRFSTSWARATTQPGIDFYSRLVDALLEAKIRPFVTLYHWDMPQFIEDKGGWTNRDSIALFAEHTNRVARALADRVKDFIVMNEPMIFLTLGYLLGVHAPGRRGFKNFFSSSHHVLLAQAEAARQLRSIVPDAQIGTTISATAAYPATTSRRDILAADRFDTLYNTFYLEPVLGKGYPTRHFPALRRIEKFVRGDDMTKLQFDFDFWGLNTYTRKRVRYSRVTPFVQWREVKSPKGAKETVMKWEVYPQGIYDLLSKYAKYPEIKKLYVTENGAAFHDHLVAGRVADSERIEYLRAYTDQVLRARAEHAKIAGYFAWSLMDNFEWAEGFHAGFGLVHINYHTQKRTIKDSGHWYRQRIQKNLDSTEGLQSGRS